MFMNDFLIFLGSVVLVTSMEKTSMYMKKSKLNDQQMSSSEYSYDIQNEPWSELLQTDDIGIETLKKLDYPSSMQLHRYAENYKPLSNIQFSKENSHEEEPVIPAYKLLPYYKVGLPSLYSERKHIGKHLLGTSYLYPYASGYDTESQLKGLVIKNGNALDDLYKSQHGQRFDSSYNQADAFEKALNGEFDKKITQSSNSADGSKRGSFFDKGRNGKVDYNTGASAQGSSFHQNDSHDKSSKTSGFHNLYSKDDYDKQHTFYDRADKKGHFIKYGDLDTNYRGFKGISKEGGKNKRGYDISNLGRRGLINTGRFEDHEKGFENDDGKEKVHRSRNFNEKAGKEEESRGYSN